MRNHLYVLLEGKEQVLDDVVDALALIMHDELLINPSAYPKCAAITRPLCACYVEYGVHNGSSTTYGGGRDLWLRPH